MVKLFNIAIAVGDGGEGNGYEVIGEVHDNGGPYGAGVVGEIAEGGAKRKAREEAAELKVNEAKECCADPYRGVGAACEAQEALLQRAAEKEFLADGRRNGDDQRVNQVARQRVNR